MARVVQTGTRASRAKNQRRYRGTGGAQNKKKAPLGAFLVLTAIIILLGSYLLQFLCLDNLTAQHRVCGAAATGH